MKKLIVFALVLSVIAAVFSGCASTPKQFTGQWKFSAISKVELASGTSEERIAELMQEYGAEDKAGIEAKALAALTADKIFNPCYVNFGDKYTYTYDPILNREATWTFYKTGDNTGFISFYGELNAADGNPDPSFHPDIVYNAESGTLLMTLGYYDFMVTVELCR